jgi:hypothetical protein
MLISIVLGGGILYLTFDRQEGNQLIQSLHLIKWNGLALYCLLFLFSHGLRIIRWGNLIQASTPLSWSSLFSIGAQGYALIALLPFRMGELSRPFLLQKHHNTPFSTTVGTLLIERVADGLMCIGFFGLSLALFVPQISTQNAQSSALFFIMAGAWSLGLLFIGILVGILFLLWKPKILTLFLHKTVGRISPSWEKACLKLSDDLHQGLHFTPRQWGTFILITIVYWGIQGCLFPIMAYATGLPIFSLIHSFILLSVVVLGIMIPAGPGFTGSFELAVKGGLLILMIPDHPHIPLFIACLHLSQLSTQVGLGGVAWMWMGHSEPKEIP